MKVFVKSLSPFAVRAGLTVVAAVFLSGCQSQTPTSEMALLAANDYQVRHPIVVTEQPETLDLPIGYNTRSLNGYLSESITAFAMKSRKNGNGRVEILVPAGAANEAAVHAVVPEIRNALKRGGLGRGRISTRSYPVEDGSADAPIRLSYPRVMATAGPCGEWPKNIGGEFGPNTDYENFGCATQANLAATVSNPADLITPRAVRPADQQRRAVVFEKYRAGEQTASDYKEGVGASVSE